MRPVGRLSRTSDQELSHHIRDGLVVEAVGVPSGQTLLLNKILEYYLVANSYIRFVKVRLFFSLLCAAERGSLTSTLLLRFGVHSLFSYLSEI